MDVTNNWHEDNRALWDAIIDHYFDGGHDLHTYLEIGSFEGASACHIIDRMGTSGGGLVVCVDLWEEDYKDKVSDTSVRDYNMPTVYSRFKKNTNMCLDRYPSVDLEEEHGRSCVELARMVADQQLFDMIYVDGSHLARDVLIDAVLGFHLLRPGGIMIFDDYYWTSNPNAPYNPNYAPKVAIDAFVTANFDDIQFMPAASRQLIVRRKIND